MSNLAVKSQPLFCDNFYNKIISTEKNSPCLVNAGSTISSIKISREDPKQLRAVNDRLVTISKRLNVKHSAEYVALREEIGKHGHKGYKILNANLSLFKERINDILPKNCLHRLAIRVINFFAKLFGCKGIKAPSSEHIENIQAKLKDILKELIKERKDGANHTLEVMGSIRPDTLTAENLQAMELGLRDAISFQVGSRQYVLLYDNKEQSFILRLTHCAEEVSPFQLQEQNSPAKVQVFKTSVIDKEEDRVLNLMYKSLYSPKRNGGFKASWKNSHLTLKPGREYEIITQSLDSVRFKILQKTGAVFQKAAA